jgi:YihY family inner membrane protein
MISVLREIPNIFKRAFLSFLNSDCGNLSAAIAFYSLLSLFPLVMILISASGYFIRHFSLQQAIIHQATQLLPTGEETIHDNLVSISRNFGRVQLLSFVLLWWSASGVFMSMESAMNRAWQVTRGRSYWRRHLLALGMALLYGTLLIFSLGATALQRQIEHASLTRQIEWNSARLVSPAAHILFLFTPLFFSFITFILIYRFIPNHPIRIRDVIGGAVVGSVLWEIAKHVFAALLPFFNYRHLYGSLGAAVAFMMWGYISSLILLFGAEFAAATKNADRH